MSGKTGAEPLRATLARVLRVFAEPTEGAVDALVQHAHVRHYGRGDYLLRGGERATHVMAVLEGLLREHYVDAHGVEHTRSFVREGEVSGSLVDLLSGRPAMTYVEALEPTRALVFPYDALDALSAEHPSLTEVLRRSAEALAVRKTRREHELLTKSADERYATWCAEHRELDARVSRKLVASYLGITPEHLSRLRARVTRRVRIRSTES